MHPRAILYYDDAVYGTRLHSGRISEVYTLQDGTASDFSIAYDAHWRYARGVDALHPKLYESFAYDAMGNVTELVHSTPDGLVNAVSLSYVGNRLSSAHAIPGKTASSSAKKQYPPMVYAATAEKNAYLCDGNGNERRHLAHRVASSSYNMLNLPSDVTFTDKNSLRMKYTADGRRVETLSKTWLTPLVVPSDTLPAFDSTLTVTPLPAPSLAGASPQTLPTLPSGSIGGATLPGTIPGWQFGGGLTPNIPYSLHREWRIGRIVLEDSLITRIDIPDGHIDVSRDGGGYGPLLCYRYVTDHLGSVRTAYLIHPVSGNSVPVQHIRYMPSGAVLGNTGPALQHRLFCGKELLPQHGWKVYDSHARMQCNVLPRFTSPDPLGEKYCHLSPYAYGADDPVNMVDIEGKEPTGYEALLMAKHVYGGDNAKATIDDLNKAGWYVSRLKTGIREHMNYTKWYQHGLQSCIYERLKPDGKKEYAYAFAGTNSLEDALEDAAQVIGCAPQYGRAVLNAIILSQELESSELTFIGHSLGGSEAAAASMATGRNAITFNRAFVSESTKKILKLNHGIDKITNYQTDSDPLTNIQDLLGVGVKGKKIKIQTNRSSSHGIDNFFLTF